ncbi:hypothetical protein TYRP_023699, partial [Tyrophagus putrescentiae]
LATLLEALPFLPIGIVLSLMFFCLCLVLRLFSKARFRDNRSSIFVNPADSEKWPRRRSAACRSSRSCPVTAVAIFPVELLDHLDHLDHLERPPVLRLTPITRDQLAAATVQTSTPSMTRLLLRIYVRNEICGSNTPTSSVLMKAKSRSNSISSSKLLP